MLVTPRVNAALGASEQGRVTTDDGVELLYQSFGATNAPALVFANGIGVRYPGAARQVEGLRGRYRVITWDYRGIGQSVMPADAELSLPRHARDILAVLDRLAIDRAIFVGWSMGSQVALEVARLQPHRLAGFVALLGSYGRPFRQAFPGPVGPAMEQLFALVQRKPQLLQLVFDAAVALPTTAFGLLSGLRFVAAQTDREIFAANVRSVAGVEKGRYLRMMLELAAHDAGDMLPRLGCPALVIAGSRDYLTPPRVARRMVRQIPDCTYREVAGGTHFALIEQPQLINGWLEEFAARVFGTAADGDGSRQAAG